MNWRISWSEVICFHLWWKCFNQPARATCFLRIFTILLSRKHLIASSCWWVSGGSGWDSPGVADDIMNAHSGEPLSVDSISDMSFAPKRVWFHCFVSVSHFDCCGWNWSCDVSCIPKTWVWHGVQSMLWKSHVLPGSCLLKMMSIVQIQVWISGRTFSSSWWWSSL